MPRDNDLDLLEDLAERMGLDDSQRESFINNGMKKLGYKPRMDWDEPESDGSGDNVDDMFGGSTQRRQRRVGGNQRDSQRDQGRRASGSNWQYDG